MTYAMPLPIPVVTTDRLTLREPRDGDFPAMLAFNDSPRSGADAAGDCHICRHTGPEARA
jgi:hypothetical protein